MPLSKYEQVVIAHKFLLDLTTAFKLPVNLADKADRYIGHSELVLFNTRNICEKIAEQSFRRRLGARCVKSAVANIKTAFVKAYRKMDGLVDKSVNEGPLLKFDPVIETTAAGDVGFVVRQQAKPESAPGSPIVVDEVVPKSHMPRRPEEDTPHVLKKPARKRKKSNTPPLIPAQMPIRLRPREG